MRMLGYLTMVRNETDAPSNPKRPGVAKGIATDRAIKAKAAGWVVFSTVGDSGRMTRVTITKKGRAEILRLALVPA